MSIAQLLRSCELFRELDDNELAEILPLCHEVQFNEGQALFRGGQEARTFYVLRQGKVRLDYEICPQPDACQDAIIYLDTPGDLICWSALVRPHRLSASGHAITPVQAVAVDATRLNELMENNSHIGFVMLKALAGIISERLKTASGLTLGRRMGAL